MRLFFVGDVAIGNSRRFVTDTRVGAFVANIEGPVVSTADGPLLGGHPYSTLHGLKSFFGEGLAVACVANNHAAGLGEEGMEGTCQHLESMGALVVGTPCGGRADAVHLDTGGLRVAFLARAGLDSFGGREAALRAAPLVRLLDADELLAAVVSQRTHSDRVVVMLHWGQEWLTAPSPSRVELARKLIKAGADLVVGHHSHIAEAWEQHLDRSIVYGLGTVELRFPNTPNADVGKPRDGGRRAWWARRSIVVDWNALTNASEVRSASWSENVFCVGNAASSSRALLRYLNSPSQSMFARITRRDYWRSKLRTAWQEKIIPRPSHLRSLIGIFGEARGASTSA